MHYKLETADISLVLLKDKMLGDGLLRLSCVAMEKCSPHVILVVVSKDQMVGCPSYIQPFIPHFSFVLCFEFLFQCEMYFRTCNACFETTSSTYKETNSAEVEMIFSIVCVCVCVYNDISLNIDH